MDLTKNSSPGGAISVEGLLRNGKRHGKWKYYYRSSGLKAVGNYVDGELDGNWEWWRENRQPLQAGAFKNGKQVGLWKRYYENGQLWDEGTYEDGGKLASGKYTTKLVRSNKGTSSRRRGKTCPREFGGQHAAPTGRRDRAPRTGEET